MTFFERHKVQRVVNALGTSTIVGANVAPPEVIAAAAEALGASCEIDELQRAACRAIAEATGAEAGCVTSSASSAPSIRRTRLWIRVTCRRYRRSKAEESPPAARATSASSPASVVEPPPVNAIAAVAKVTRYSQLDARGPGRVDRGN